MPKGASPSSSFSHLFFCLCMTSSSLSLILKIAFLLSGQVASGSSCLLYPFSSQIQWEEQGQRLPFFFFFFQNQGRGKAIREDRGQRLTMYQSGSERHGNPAACLNSIVFLTRSVWKVVYLKHQCSPFFFAKEKSLKTQEKTQSSRKMASRHKQLLAPGFRYQNNRRQKLPVLPHIGILAAVNYMCLSGTPLEVE